MADTIDKALECEDMLDRQLDRQRRQLDRLRTQLAEAQSTIANLRDERDKMLDGGIRRAEITREQNEALTAAGIPEHEGVVQLGTLTRIQMLAAQLADATDALRYISACVDGNDQEEGESMANFAKRAIGAFVQEWNAQDSQLAERDRQLEALEALLVEMRRVLALHHGWHQEQTDEDPVIKCSLAEAYSESGMCDATIEALSRNALTAAHQRVEQRIEAAVAKAREEVLAALDRLTAGSGRELADRIRNGEKP